MTHEIAAATHFPLSVRVSIWYAAVFVFVICVAVCVCVLVSSARLWQSNIACSWCRSVNNLGLNTYKQLHGILRIRTAGHFAKMLTRAHKHIYTPDWHYKYT